MAKQTTKDQLLNNIRVEHRRLENQLTKLSEEQMLKPGVTGAWSVKDILAHLSAWENLFLDWYQSGITHLAPVVIPVGMSRKMIDAVNLDIYQKNQNRGLAEVLNAFQVSYLQVVEVITSIKEEDLFSHDRFEWTGALRLADYVAGNTCNHYAWARKQIHRFFKNE